MQANLFYDIGSYSNMSLCFLVYYSITRVHYWVRRRIVDRGLGGHPDVNMTDDHATCTPF